MHLRSLTLRGFKSFPDRTKLEFSPGVSVIVGPNGSGKSNITDAVLWALGEQSPLAVRGQTMSDVIFAGGAGAPSRNLAEVEVVIDNAGGTYTSEFSELSIVRRLGRDGEGEYRLNGARCRLVDVLEVLSDTGLGKEMHSVVSQGRVEAIIHSKPRDRRLLIEEAAGLGKHRKRRRRAELKLQRTEQNLSRALDVEREARSRLRPLKRQAEAAELHERLERQSLEARMELTREEVRSLSADLGAAETAAAAARGERDEADGRLAAVARRREQAEQAFARQSRVREALTGRLFGARSAAERIAMRAERAGEAAQAATDSAERRRHELELLEADAAEARPDERSGDRIAALEAELRELDERRRERLEEELAGLARERAEAERRRDELDAAAAERREQLHAAERKAEQARAERGAAERAAEAARREAARVGAELAAANQFLRTAAGAAGGAPSLAEGVAVDAGYERALAAALGPRLSAGVVADVPAGERLLDDAGRDGGTAIVARAPGAAPRKPPSAPTPAAEPLAERVRADGPAATAVERLLAGVWVVESLAALDAAFTGVAVTKAGRLFDAATGELHQAPAGGQERVLEERNRRDELVAASEAAARAEAAALGAVESAAEAVTAADALREQAEAALRAAVRETEEAAEAARRAAWLIERRREAPDEGEAAVRRAHAEAELASERRHAERARREAEERDRRRVALREGIARDERLLARAERAGAVLQEAQSAVVLRRDALARELAADEQVGERTAAELRACAHEEAELQGRLRRASESVTTTEVRAQQVRDAVREAEAELAAVAERLGFEPEPEPVPARLGDERRGELEARIELLARRREQLGPVNPLAKQEYDEAVDHVEELEAQRSDLESALAELEKVIRETDRRIRETFEETFELAARNFEEVVKDLFPGGRGRLRLVHPESPRPVLGGQPAPADRDGAAAVEAAEDAAEAEEAPAAEEPGVEVEVTPAGKSMKRLSLLSGGEKSLVALAFMFAVFLARPCPFYILDEVEAALDDLNIDRFLQLVRRYSDRAQFIVVTHQKRTMDAADCIYGVSMGGDGVSKVVSRRLADAPRSLEPVPDAGSEEAA